MVYQHINGITLVSGWWYTYPSVKYEFVSGMMTFPIYGKVKNDPNHQPVYIYIISGKKSGTPFRNCIWV
jgi:hypothetical protein